ncbi:MAG: hypothetical protein QM655_12625 [Nocardioidaceae bacterium]
MARRAKAEAVSSETEQVPEETQGKRAYDEHGNVRPADGRWPLHDPEDESHHR